MTTYYPDSKAANITKADISAVSDFLEKKGLLVVCSMSRSRVLFSGRINAKDRKTPG
jgi:hypothetical protein